MKKKIKSFIIKMISGFADKTIYLSQQKQNTQVAQVQIANQYLLMKKLLPASEMPSFKDVGFKVYSQFEEDGILLYIFSIIGTTNKRVVEICAGNGFECMAANLIVNHGWFGLLFDGNKELVKRGSNFFAHNRSTALHPPIYKCAWLTKDNINQLIEDNGFSGEIDLLSLDMDGNDYYIMEAISVIKPRVIICEINNVIPADLAITIPYKSDYTNFINDNNNESTHPDFVSVSLLAMKKLLNKKGYRLVGSHRFGFNAIFIQNGIGTEFFPEVAVESLLCDSYTKLRNSTTWETIKDLPWVTI
jgi:hypothetical protein